MILVNRILIATGWPKWTKSEVIALDNPNLSCHDWNNFTMEVSGATGGILSSKSAIVCGGDVTTNVYHSSNECFLLGQDSFTPIGKMSARRSYAISMVTTDKRNPTFNCNM